jgi:hypothetical protein
MKIPRIWAGVVACVLGCAVANAAGATTYYVSSGGGDDTKDGLTTATAWKSIAKVNASSFSAGDQILFKRGDVWRESLVPPSSGTSGSPIKFDAYGSGDAPTITGSQDLPASSWTLDSGNIWKTSITSASFNYILFGGGIWGLKHTTGKSACVAPYDFYFASNVLYVYSAGNPATYYGSVAAMLMTNGQPGRMRIAEEKISILERSEIRRSVHDRIVNAVITVVISAAIALHDHLGLK